MSNIKYRVDIKNYGIEIKGLTTEEEAILKYAFGEQELREGGAGFAYQTEVFLRNVGIKVDVEKSGEFANRVIKISGEVMPYELILKDIGKERIEKERCRRGLVETRRLIKQYEAEYQSLIDQLDRNTSHASELLIGGKLEVIGKVISDLKEVEEKLYQ